MWLRLHCWCGELRNGSAYLAKSWNLDTFRIAVDEARHGFEEGGVPIGAALEMNGKLVASGRNERVQLGDPIAHGEVACLRRAGRQLSYRDAILYTTLAPCPMCAGSVVLFKIPMVVVGEDRTFSGELEYLRERGVEVVLLDDPACIELMQEFQRRFPDVWAEDIGEVPDGQ